MIWSLEQWDHCVHKRTWAYFMMGQIWSHRKKQKSIALSDEKKLALWWHNLSCWINLYLNLFLDSFVMWSCKSLFQLRRFQLDFLKGSWPVEGVYSGSVVDWVWIWIQIYLGSYPDAALTGCEVMDTTSSFWDPVLFWKVAINPLPTYQRCPAQSLSNTVGN